jgi:tetratricopeptide (TPR) repeat protein
VERALADQEAELRKQQAEQSYARATEFLHQGRLNESVKWINEGLKLDSNHPGLRDLRAQVERALADQEAELRKQQAEQSYARATEFLKQGKLNECLEQIKAGLRLDSNHRGLRDLWVELEKAKTAQPKSGQDEEPRIRVGGSGTGF